MSRYHINAGVPRNTGEFMSYFLPNKWVIPALTLVIGATSLLAQGPDHMKNHSKIKGPEACGECHKSEVAVWKETRHHKTFYELTRSEKAREIAEKMGLRRIKRESDCLSCHFTSVEEAGTVKPIAGISCESCHGAAVDWIEVHNDYGGKDVKREEETAEHKQERLKRSVELGMLRPDDLYAVAANCFSCHTVPNENLVNTGGHAAGSKFELVSWSQGEIRHNFFSSESGQDNIEATPQHKRMMYVLGRALDLEYGLRGTAKATAKATYAVEMAKRAKRAVLYLKQIQEAVATDEVAAMIAIGDGASLKLNNESELLAAADKVAEQAKKFAASHDGSGLAGIDSLIPGPDKYKGKPAL